MSLDGKGVKNMNINELKICKNSPNMNEKVPILTRHELL